jgi:membrane dipeptidase
VDGRVDGEEAVSVPLVLVLETRLIYVLCSVGIGSDFDGIETVPKGMEDVSKYPALVRLLTHQDSATC